MHSTNGTEQMSKASEAFYNALASGLDLEEAQRAADAVLAAEVQS
jgi:hypothetical protein